MEEIKRLELWLNSTSLKYYLYPTEVRTTIQKKVNDILRKAIEYHNRPYFTDSHGRPIFNTTGQRRKKALIADGYYLMNVLEFMKKDFSK